eukprot:jgi/Astpho2/6218/e_gw1.00088.130.1_t
MGKAKPASHTSKELAAKAKAALTNKGGGQSGKIDRLGGTAGHAKYKCPICAQQAPDLKSMEAHHDSKHSKMGAFNPQQCIDAHAAAGGVTTQGVAVRGSQKIRHK